jgi:hypothetical protein
VLRIFIALKNPSSWQVSNPRPLGPVASTTTPPRRLVQWVPGDLSPGVMRGRGVTLTTYPHLVPVVNEWELFLFYLLRLNRCVVGLLYFNPYFTKSE